MKLKLIALLTALVCFLLPATAWAETATSTDVNDIYQYTGYVYI